jgi:hypothetical protein
MRSLDGYEKRSPKQRERILELLRAAGPAGVTNEHLYFAEHIINPTARISELRVKLGCTITAEAKGGGLWVFRLVAEPPPTPPADAPAASPSQPAEEQRELFAAGQDRRQA